MAHQAKRSAKRAQRGMIQKVKENPIPAALIGLGLGWLMMSGDHDEDVYDRGRYYGYDYDYEVYERPARYAGPREMDYEWREYETYPRRESYAYARSDMDRAYYGEEGRMEEARHRARDAAESARARAGNVAHQAQEQAGHMQERVQEQADHLRHQVQEQASHMGDRMQDQADYLRRQAQYQTRRARRGFDQTMNSNPLAVGALAAAAGALIGLAVPTTHAEEEWMGEARDRFMHEVEDKAQETMDKAKTVAKEATEATKEASKEVADRTKEEAKQQSRAGSPKG